VGGQLVVAGAFLRGTVEVVVARHAALAGAVDEGFDQLVLGPDVRHAQGAVGAVPGIGAALVGFGA
jgi:hypothetical protein